MTRSIAASPVATLRAARFALVLIVAMVACSSNEIEKDGPLRVKDAWARATKGTGIGAMYLTLENTDTGAVMILGAATPMAAAAEFHETAEMDGMSHMTKLDSIPVARGATLTMKPGGLHVMLIDLKMSIAAGDTVPLVLQFRDGRRTSAKAVARAQ